MSDTPKTTSASLKWICRILGVLLILASLYELFITGMAFWALMHSKTGLMTSGGQPLAMLLGRFVGSLLFIFIGVRLMQVGGKKAAAIAAATDQTVALHSPITLAHTQKSRRAARRWQSCNILQIRTDSRRLWNFSAGKNGFNPNQEQTLNPLEPLPTALVARDWKTLLQPRLNISWLPVDQVFLRVVQLPVSSFEETLAMTELQLEKISPLPVTQVIWSIQVMPKHVDNLQTVIVTIMSSDLVEKFLGDLENRGFLADRLELPILDQLLATPIAEDGAYIYPSVGTEKLTALVAWWHAGVLRNLGLVHVPTSDNSAAVLQEQLAQMAWSGELEGWLKGDPSWHLVADQATAATWQPLFRPWCAQVVPVLTPLAETQLAVASANRAARAETESGMMPVEYSKRYAQQFYDRLWMRALAAGLMIYVAVVTVYMALAAWRTMSTEELERNTASLSRQYTNALTFKAQLEILQNRQALKFASLDCWKKTAELLPEGITVRTLEFKDGKHYNLSGMAPTDKSDALTDFNEALRKSTLDDGKPMFEKMDIPMIKLNPGGATLDWSFSGELARSEEAK